jgi:hypothetical protein
MFGISDGFDIVIGNPDSCASKASQATQSQYIERYKRLYNIKGNYDLYALFIERGYDSSSDSNMIMAYWPILCHSKFFIAKFGEGLRKLLTERQALASIVKFGALQLFDDATTYSSLVFLSAEKQASFDLVEISLLDQDVLNVTLHRNNQSGAIEYSHPALAFERIINPQNTTWHS